MSLTAEPLDGIDALASPPAGAALAWLGQAGFLIAAGGQRILIDPYLSDSLAAKYAGTRFPHIRMMPPPIAPEDLHGIGWLFCTHGHTDHMDPGTIPGLLAANPACRVVAPRAERARAIERGVPEERLILIDAGETMDLVGLRVTATAAAHETLDIDAAGHFHYLGYAIEAGGVTIWHSGDTVPFDGLAAELAGPVDLALLPINGRDAERAANGVPGNLTVEEALALVDRIGAKALICHHFGLFDFNTADPAAALAAIGRAGPAADCRLAELGTAFRVARGGGNNDTHGRNA